MPVDIQVGQMYEVAKPFPSLDGTVCFYPSAHLTIISTPSSNASPYYVVLAPGNVNVMVEKHAIATCCVLVYQPPSISVFGPPVATSGVSWLTAGSLYTTEYGDDLTGELPEAPCPILRKCECGQIGVSYAIHSDYCPLYEKKVNSP